MNFKIPTSIIVDYLESNFQVKQTTTGLYRINSFLFNDNDFHLYVDPSSGKWFDQHEQRGGKGFESFVAEHQGISNNEVLPFLLKDFDVNLIFSEQQKERTWTPKQIKHSIEIPRNTRFFFENKIDSPIYKKSFQYLKTRRIPEKNIMDLGYIYSPGEPYNNRILIPFYENGLLVYFVARAMFKTNLRYMNPPNYDSKNYVLNIDKMEDEIFIFEGAMDALSLKDQIGTAILSADIGHIQVKKIMDKNPKRIVFVPDRDKTGKKTLGANLKKLIRGKEAIKCEILVYKVPEPFKDFNEYAIGTGNNFIDIKDCVSYQKMDYDDLFEELKKR